MKTLDEWKEMDNVIDARSAELFQTFSHRQLAVMCATNEILLAHRTAQLDELNRQTESKILALAGEIVIDPESTPEQREEVARISTLIESMEHIKNLGFVKAAYEASHRGKSAVEARHNGPDGARVKQAKIRELWMSGKYSSRDVCAEQECAALNMSFSSARRALRNTPKPT